MYILLGGTGHVGSAAAMRLLHEGRQVTIISRSMDKADEWKARGARVEQADVNDAPRLRDILSTGKRLFLLNPPAAPDTDTDLVERKSVACILKAMDGLSPERVVVHSTYGAQPGEDLGDLNVLYELEQELRDKPYPVHVVRAAYYFSNWDMAVDEARAAGRLTSFYPENFSLPMVAPQDLGEAAARFLSADDCPPGIHYVEGPRRYTPRDVADAIGAALGKPVGVRVVAEQDWENAYRQAGFSPSAARSYSRMTDVTLHERYEVPENPVRGNLTLADYFKAHAKGSEG